jgi:hypothetical protein
MVSAPFTMCSAFAMVTHVSMPERVKRLPRP